MKCLDARTAYVCLNLGDFQTTPIVMEGASTRNCVTLITSRTSSRRRPLPILHEARLVIHHKSSFSRPPFRLLSCSILPLRKKNRCREGRSHTDHGGVEEWRSGKCFLRVEGRRRIEKKKRAADKSHSFYRPSLLRNYSLLI